MDGGKAGGGGEGGGGAANAIIRVVFGDITFPLQKGRKRERGGCMKKANAGEMLRRGCPASFIVRYVFLPLPNPNISIVKARQGSIRDGMGWV